jgi:hypothetical protein
MLHDIVMAMFTLILGTGFSFILSSRKQLFPRFLAATLFRKKKLRVSMAALLSIEHNGKYLLIRNYRRQELFSPIGGAYKYSPSANVELEAIGFEPQCAVSDLKNDMLFDLRGFVQGDRFSKFIKWFMLGSHREIEPLQREIYEELDEVNLSSLLEGVKPLRFRHTKTLSEGLRKVRGESYLQFRHFDILEIIEDKNSLLFLSKLFSASEENPQKLIFATADEIRNGRTAKRELIAGNAVYLLKYFRPAPEPIPIHTA